MSGITALMAIGMLVTGALNTLSIKYQDKVVVGHTHNGAPIAFYHPAFQSACMFLGEFLCIIPYLLQRWRAWSEKKRQIDETPFDSYYEASEPLLHGAPVAQRQHLVTHPRTATAHVVGGQSGTSDDVSYSVFMLALPTLCDAASTTLMNIGLYYTSASTFQMLRGFVVFFAGLFTIMILKRRLYLHHWQGMMLITVGAFIVGLSSLVSSTGCPDRHRLPPYAPPYGPPYNAPSHAPALHSEPCFGDSDCEPLWLHDDAIASAAPAEGAAGHFMGHLSAKFVPQLAAFSFRSHGGESAEQCSIGHEPLLGNACVLAAQIFAALQYVVEEKYVKAYRVPASLAVGLEGFWGLILSCILLPLFQHLPAPGGRNLPVDDIQGAFAAIASIPALAAAVAAAILSMGLFNWFGVCITISLSGVTRLTIDACRTLLVWAVSLLLGWESFNSFQLLGFFVLVCGATLYNELMATLLEQPMRAASSQGLGPQYNRMPLRGRTQMQGQPFEVSPALRIAGAGVRPHSLASMGGFASESPGSDMWGVSLGTSGAPPGTLRAAGAPPGGGPQAEVPPGGASGAGPRRLASASERAMSSFSKYKMYYSGFDVGVTPPMAVGAMGRGSVGSAGGASASLSQTPRPGEFANTAGQEWDGLSQSVRSDSVRPLAPPPDVPAPGISRPNSPFVIAPPTEQPLDARPSRSILSEQLSKRSDPQATTGSVSRAVPARVAARHAALPMSSSDPVLRLHDAVVAAQGEADAGTGADTEGGDEDPGAATGAPTAGAAEQGAAAQHRSQESADASTGPSAYSLDMSGEFNMK